MHHRHPQAHRRGFTLAEVLIAVVIILVLITIGAFAVLRMRDTGPYHATVANMNKIKAALDSQWKAVVDKARKDAIPASFPGNKTQPQTRQQYIDAMVKQAFPTTFADATTDNASTGIKAWGGYKSFLTSPPSIPASDPLKAEKESAICLLMVLERGPSGGEVTQDRLGSSGAMQIVGSFYGCVDAWGNPLRFTRQTSSYELRSSGPDGKFGTEDDIVSSKDL